MKYINPIPTTHDFKKCLKENKAYYDADKIHRRRKDYKHNKVG